MGVDETGGLYQGDGGGKKKDPTPQQEHISLVQYQGSSGGVSVPPTAGSSPGSGGSAASTQTWILTHQRFLRALGYSIRVDGVWGPQSQRAWQQYLKRRGVSSSQAASSFDRDRQELMVFNRRLAATQARQKAQLAQTISQIQAAQRIIGGGLFAPGDGDAREPQLGRLGIMEDQIAAEAESRRRAEFLGTDRGQAATTVMYISQRLAGPNRNKVLAGMSAEHLRTLLFDPEFGAMRSPGDAQGGVGVALLQGYLRTHGYGKVRVTGRLDLDTYEGLTREMVKLAREEWRENVSQIKDLFYGKAGEVRVDGPINLRDLPGFRGKIPTARELAARLAVDDPVSRRLLRELYHRLSVKQMAELRYKMGHAKTLQVAEAQASYEFMAAAARRAEEGGILGTIARPFDWLTDHTRAGAVLIYHTLDALAHGDWLSNEEMDELLKESEAEVKLFDTRHPYLGIATQLLADPTILIPGRVLLAPFVLGGKGARSAALFLEEAGYALSSTGRIVRLPALSLTVPARAGRLAGAGAEEFADFLRVHPVSGRIWMEARHATRLLGDTRRAAHMRTEAALRRGFNVAVTRPLAAVGVAPKVPKEVADLYDAALDGFVKQVDAPSGDIVSEAVRLRLSVFNRDSLEGDDISDFGRMLRGNFAASARLHAVLDLADDRAFSAVDALRNTKNPGGDVLQREYERVFEQTVEEAGPYAMGSSEWDDIINQRVQLALQAFNRAYLPALQRRIELALDDLGESLWDVETGAWIGANGDVTETLRKLGAEQFADDVAQEVPNPLYKRYYTHKESLDFQERELRIRTAQKESWASARVSAGESLPDEWLEKEVAGIRQELNRAWVRVSDGPNKGKFTDTRATLKVAPHYARQYEWIRNLRPAQVIRRGGKDPDETFRLSDVARSPYKQMRGGELDLGYMPLQLSVDRIASYFRFVRPEGDELPAIARGYEYLLDGERGAGDLMPDELEVLRMRDFQAAYVEFGEAYKSAYDNLFAQSLAREGALYSALRYSQHKTLRGTWYAAEGWLGLWRFMVLPLRFGWTAVNYIDNTVKALLQGVVSPKFWFRSLQGGGETALDIADGARTVFEAGWSEIRHITRFFDQMFGTDMTSTIDAAFDAFWKLPYDLHAKVFSLHGFEFPEEFLEKAVYAREGSRILKRVEDLGDDATALDVAQARLATFHDRVWDMMGNRAENFARRATYYRTYEKSIKQGYGQLDAHTLAWSKVEETLFDYSKISTFEDNVRFIVPFIQWARKNNQFWLRKAAQRPALTLGVMDAYSDFRSQVNEDLPEWMHRYMPLRWASDVVSRVPALRWLAGPLADSVTDPINVLSVKNLYRFFKSENPELPADRAGIAFADSLVEALEDFGFSMNPLVRKPLELSHVLSLRTWQNIFPQTTLVEAFTRKFFNERFPNGLNLEIMFEDAILNLMGAEPTADDAADNLDVYVRMEMAAQAHRGEAISREAAEKKIADWFYVQAIVGYFAGIYLRRMTPEDIYYAQIADQMRLNELDFADLTDEERANYRLYKFANLTAAERRQLAEDLGVPVGSLPDNAMYDRYVEQLPLIRSYYAIPSYVEARSFLNDHKELMPFVEENLADYSGEQGYVAKARLNEQTDLAFSLFGLADDLDLSPETTKAAEQLLVTPELRAYWSSNDTPAERRQKMLRGQFHRHISSLNRAYHAIPEDDFDAREGFLRENPLLLRSWWNDNQDSDDFKVIVQSVNADLRDRYFEYVEAGDWDGAGAFLSQFPFMFDSVDAKNRLDPDYATGRSKRFTQAQHAALFAKARRWLDRYWSMAPADRAAWLNSDAEGAKEVRDYLAAFGSSRPGSQGGLSQHAQDYLAAKRWLDHYFSMSPAARSAWLRGGSEGASVVLAYFKRYGSVNRVGRSFEGVNPAMLGSRNAELARRLAFWQRYFALPASERPLFVMRNAADYGIFVYGVLGAKERHDAEMAWLRRAFLAGMSSRAAHYLYVKPLLDFYFKIKNKDARRLFLRANPEVQAYFDMFAPSLTGDPKLDKLIERYFRLPENSNERSLFLRQHPQVQHYFDQQSSPADRAMRNLLNVYFNIDSPQERDKFLARHPEVVSYFEKRQRERDAERAQLSAFDEADPRFAPYRLFAEESVTESADWMRRVLAGTQLTGGLEVRRTRR